MDEMLGLKHGFSTFQETVWSHLNGYPRKHIVIFSRMHFVTFIRVYNMHQDTKSARIIAVCKRTFTEF